VQRGQCREPLRRMPVGGVGLRLSCPCASPVVCAAAPVCGLSAVGTAEGRDVTLHQELVAAVAGALRRSRGQGLSDHELARAAVAAAGRYLESASPRVVVAGYLESSADVRRLGRWVAGSPRCHACVDGRWHMWHDNGDAA